LNLGIKSSERQQNFLARKPHGRRGLFALGEVNADRHPYYHGVYVHNQGKKRHIAIVSDGLRQYPVPGLYDSAIEAAVAHDEYIIRNKSAVSSLNSCDMIFDHDTSLRDLGYLFSEDEKISMKRNLKNLKTQTQIKRWNDLLRENKKQTAADPGPSTNYRHECDILHSNTEVMTFGISFDSAHSTHSNSFTENLSSIPMKNSIRSILRGNIVDSTPFDNSQIDFENNSPIESSLLNTTRCGYRKQERPKRMQVL